MAIQECILFQGGFVKSYQDLLDARIEELPGDDLERIRLSLDDVPESDPEDVLDEIFNDDELWMTDVREIVVDHLQEWTPRGAGDLLDRMDQTQTDWRVVLIMRSGADVDQRIVNMLTEKPHEHFIPYDQVELTDWIVNWMLDRDINISDEDAESLAYYGGESLDVIVDALHTVSLSFRSRTVAWNDLTEISAKAGILPMWELMTAITSGGSGEAIQIMDRLLTHVHPLQVISMLVNRYRDYLKITSKRRGRPEEVASLLGTGTGRARYILKEAKALGEQGAVDSYMHIVHAERALKGDSLKTDDVVMIALAIRLAEAFRR